MSEKEEDEELEQFAAKLREMTKGKTVVLSIQAPPPRPIRELPLWERDYLFNGVAPLGDRNPVDFIPIDYSDPLVRKEKK